MTQSCSSPVREISLFICIFNVVQVSYLGGVCDYGSVSCSLKFPNPKGCEAETRDKRVYCSSTVRRLLVHGFLPPERWLKTQRQENAGEMQ